MLPSHHSPLLTSTVEHTHAKMTVKLTITFDTISLETKLTALIFFSSITIISFFNFSYKTVNTDRIRHISHIDHPDYV